MLSKPSLNCRRRRHLSAAKWSGAKRSDARQARQPELLPKKRLLCGEPFTEFSSMIFDSAARADGVKVPSEPRLLSYLLSEVPVVAEA